MYIGGKFPRSESGRYYVPTVKGSRLGNVCRASRKDLRDAVAAARAAQPGWWARSAYNRGQILYRVAEMLENRAGQFADELASQGLTAKQAERPRRDRRRPDCLPFGSDSRKNRSGRDHKPPGCFGLR